MKWIYGISGRQIYNFKGGNILNKIKTVYKRLRICLVNFFLSLMMITNTVYADSIKESIFYTGTMKMLKDLGTALAIISPILAGVMVGYCFLRKSAADDMDQKKWSNRINIAIFSGIGGALGGVIISLIGGYFGIN